RRKRQLCSYMTLLLCRLSISPRTSLSSEGKYFTVMNLGMFLGILNGGIIAKSYSYTTVFSYASLFFLGIYAISGSMGIRDIAIKRKESENSIKNAIIFFSDIKLRKIFVSNLGLYFWSFVAFLYLPIILMSLGFDFGKIGIIFAIMIVPYIMLEYPIGRLAEKEGSKKYISLGFFAITIASFLIYVNYGAINSMILFFFLAFMGAAAIEPLNEMELDKHSKKSNIIENMSVFKTSIRIAHFLGPLSAAAMISLFGMREMFLVLAIIMVGFWWMVRK
ncbi:MAG: MFS transporter, partial [Nanoarchaeota archaeon]|nr:MFS transporter [Nanoarchaeota archaeon]